MLFSHKLLTVVSNFDQTCERYRTNPQCAQEYKTSRHERTRDAFEANPGKLYRETKKRSTEESVHAMVLQRYSDEQNGDHTGT